LKPAPQTESNPLLGLKCTVGISKDVWLKLRAGENYNLNTKSIENPYLKFWIEKDF
jgi:hypothetical protein